ncbi:hypothetical protein BCR34DRAFT_606474 [Clohesyomyces aquaticus]|uniref:DUF7708 domain-containing protein n=1 Tax=Clohesyomyces aquaticus TaxID=1231657 RepID=A0A1Y1YPG3_9PLEO|nr:hypothetical protein BCR34DRAFT_606474 [Clohesyomyces aquaticus]
MVLKNAFANDSILEETYKNAKTTISATIPAEDLAALGFDEECSVKQVQQTLQQCKAKYDSKKISKAYKWLRILSSKVVFYCPVLDVLAQARPEYASLVWGTMKFLFMSVMNHEEVIHQLSKACSYIADVLPRTEMSLILYPTERMMEAVAQLYAKVMEFMLETIKWYRQGKIGHAWAAISRPWSIGLKEHAVVIGEQARRVDKIASLAMKAEVRDTRIQVLEMQELLKSSQQQIYELSEVMKGDFKQILNLALVNRSVQSQVQLDVSSSAQMISNIQLGQILSLPFLTYLPSSGESLSYCESLYRRGLRPPKASVGIAQLRQWAERSGSSFLFPRCGLRLESREVVLEMIKLIRTSNQPLLWVLRYPKFWEKEVTWTDMLRMLVIQAIQVNPSALQKGVNPITVAHLREAASEEDWLAMLDRALVDVTQVYIVIDSELLNHAMAQNRYSTTRLLERMVGRVRCKLKLVVPMACIDKRYIDGNWNRSTWTEVNFSPAYQREVLKRRRRNERIRRRQ